MIFKEEKLKEEFWKLVPKMRVILTDAEIWGFHRAKDLVVTCLIRTEEEQRQLFELGQASAKTSVHCVGRGADLRILFPDELNQQLVDFLNMKYIYDVNRPNLKTAIRHGGTGDHVHLQCI